MKAYPTVNNFTNTRRNYFKATVLSLLCVTASVFGYSQELVFKNSSLVPGTGSAGANNAVYKFPAVTTGIDALVTIIGRSHAEVRLVAIDLSNSGYGNAFQPQVTYDRNSNNKNSTPSNRTTDYYMEFDVRFVTAGTNVPVAVESVDITALDLDGNGSALAEYATFYSLSTFITESNTRITASDVTHTLSGFPAPVKGKRFLGPTANYTDIDFTATRVMVTSTYKNVNRIRFRAGAIAEGSNSAADRMFSFWFKSFEYTDPSEGTLPVKLSSFTATKKADNKVALDWSTSQEINASHFVVERSLDGKNFDEAGLVFAAGNSNSTNNYKFTDDLRNNSGVIYYRLRMVDIDGKRENSLVRIIRTSEIKETARILTYPNPVVNELRVQFPASWQNSAVRIEVINNNGQIVKRALVNRAGQTETVNVNDLGSGLYFVRASNGTETATQRIAKVK